MRFTEALMHMEGGKVARPKGSIDRYRVRGRLEVSRGGKEWEVSYIEMNVALEGEWELVEDRTTCDRCFLPDCRGTCDEIDNRDVHRDHHHGGPSEHVWRLDFNRDVRKPWLCPLRANECDAAKDSLHASIARLERDRDDWKQKAMGANREAFAAQQALEAVRAALPPKAP